MGFGGFLQGTSPVSTHKSLFNFLRHMCPPFPLRQTLTRPWSNETEVSPVFVLIGTRQFSLDIRTHTHTQPRQLSPLETETEKPGINILIPPTSKRILSLRFHLWVCVYLQGQKWESLLHIERAAWQHWDNMVDSLNLVLINEINMFLKCILVIIYLVILQLKKIKELHCSICTNSVFKRIQKFIVNWSWTPINWTSLFRQVRMCN